MGWSDFQPSAIAKSFGKSINNTSLKNPPLERWEDFLFTSISVVSK